MKTDFKDMADELSEVGEMSESRVCERYKVDGRQEAVQCIIDWWYLQSDYECYEFYINDLNTFLFNSYQKR
jgi:hypothetical protein